MPIRCRWKIPCHFVAEQLGKNLGFRLISVRCDDVSKFRVVSDHSSRSVVRTSGRYRTRGSAAHSKPLEDTLPSCPNPEQLRPSKITNRVRNERSNMHVPDQEEALEEKAAHMEKAVIPQDVAEEAETTVEEVEESEASGSSSKPLLTSASATGPVQRSGRWTPDEKILFLYGLKRFGKGRWKKMSIYLPHR
jgi:hypothetical protein